MSGAFIRTAITIYEIPSNALGPELSKDYVERSSLLSYRYWFGWWGGLAVWNSLWIFVVYSTLTGSQDARFIADTWITYGLVCSPIMFIAIVVTATGTHRHIKDLHAPEIERKTLGIILRELYETMTVSRNYIILFIAMIMMGVASGIATNLTLYYYSFFWEFTPLNILTIGLSLFLAPLVGIVVSPFLANRFGKKNGALVLFAISLTVENGIIVLRLLGLLPENGSPIVLAGVLVFHFIGVATSVISFTTLNSMVWDTVEEVEIKTGRRMEGTLLAARSFAQKCMSGAGAFAAGMILTFAAWPENAVPGKVDPEVLFTFGVTAVTASVILWAISLFTISFVTTTKESHQEKLNELNYADNSLIKMIKDKIEEKLKTQISSLFVEVINESPNHNVPDGAESHFKVTVVSDEFENLRPVQRHQLIYKVLSDEMKLIHAIAIHPFTKTEWESNNQSSSDSPDCLGGSS